jgi:hypothetical protein
MTQRRTPPSQNEVGHPANLAQHAAPLHGEEMMLAAGNLC